MNFTVALEASLSANCSFFRQLFPNVPAAERGLFTKYVYIHMYIGNFVLPFVQTTSKIVLKCVPHVQHAYFSSFNKSYYWLFSGVVDCCRSEGKRRNEFAEWHVA